MRRFLPEKERLITHAVLLILTLVGLYITDQLEPSKNSTQILTDGFGYIALLQMVVTLLVGPLNLRKQRSNPVNIDVRRDTGIWAGITGLLHVFYGLQVHMGGDIVLYFFKRNRQHDLRLATDAFGISNDLGLIATLVLIILLILSNDISMRKLKGKLWKWLQRLNYLLGILVVLHTFGYQIVISRAPVMTQIVIAVSLLVLVAQCIGFFVYRTRQARRLAGHAAT